jgi:AraC-like DNA-binding protein
MLPSQETPINDLRRSQLQARGHYRRADGMATEKTAHETYQRCRQYIQDHWLHLLTLEQAARECHVAPAYLCRLFRRFDRQSPYQYLLRLKMTHAAERLLAPDSSVKQVADLLGFDDRFHFSRVFKRVIGVSPGQYARTHYRWPVVS